MILSNTLAEKVSGTRVWFEGWIRVSQADILQGNALFWSLIVSHLTTIHRDMSYFSAHVYLLMQ